jgi:hypothetical protein
MTGRHVQYNCRETTTSRRKQTANANSKLLKQAATTTDGNCRKRGWRGTGDGRCLKRTGGLTVGASSVIFHNIGTLSDYN